MSARFPVVALFSAILCFSPFLGKAQNIIEIPDSPKPSVENMLAGLSSYNFSDSHEIEELDFLEYYIRVQLKKYMGAICPNAFFGTDYRRPSTEHARITFTYNYKTHTTFNGNLYWDCIDLKIIFNIGLGHYKYTFTIPNFSVIGNSFPDTLYGHLRNSISSYKHYFDANAAPSLLKAKTNYTESTLKKEFIENGTSPYEGIYEDIVSDRGKDANKYKLAVKYVDNTICLIYLSGAYLYDDWHEGEIKAFLTPTASSGVFKASWITHDKYLDESAYLSFKNDGFVLNSREGNATYIKLFPIEEDLVKSEQLTEWSGTGFALKNGYIATNYHVVEGAKSIEVHGVKGNASSNYTATVVATDKNNDLAIIQITDTRFEGFGTVPYAIKNQMAEVGEDIWVLGYPLTQVLGNEIKLTNGIVSSRSGYQGDVATYQISAPVQPGNSGGPMFDSKGNIVGIVNAGVPGADNVGYAIKTSYLMNLVDSYSLSSFLPSNNTISSISLKDQVKQVNKFVYLILCSSKEKSSAPTGNTRPSTTSSSLSASIIDQSPKIETSGLSVPKMVDLGLSVVWADRNVGADTATDIGDYFSWGETITKKNFTQDTYKWIKDDHYINPSGLLDISNSEYDSAKSKFGGAWRMPTEAEIEELITKCTWAWTSINDVNGFKVTGPNGNSIFLPADGYTEMSGWFGIYWSAEVSSLSEKLSYILRFSPDQQLCESRRRESWGCIRPVSGKKTSQKTVHKKADEHIVLSGTKLNQSDYMGAYEELEKSVKLYPTPEAHFLRGYLAEKYLSNFEIAEESFLYCIENEFSVEDCHLHLAEIYLYGFCDYHNGIEHFTKFIESHEQKDKDYIKALLGRYFCNERLGEWSQCVLDCEEMLKCVTDSEIIYSESAWTYLNIKQMDKAQSCIKKALALDHNSRIIWEYDGLIQYELGNYGQCILSMNNAISIDKANGLESNSRVFYHRGLAKLHLGNIAGGYVDLEKAAVLGDKEAVEELNKLGVADIDFSKAGNYKRTIEREITSDFAGDDTKIVMIDLSEESTILYLEYTNNKYEVGGWYAIDPDTYIRDKSTGKKYYLLTTQNCALSPDDTPIKIGETSFFSLVFPALPKDVEKIDFVETENSSWRFYNIDLK